MPIVETQGPSQAQLNAASNNSGTNAIKLDIVGGLSGYTSYSSTGNLQVYGPSGWTQTTQTQTLDTQFPGGVAPIQVQTNIAPSVSTSIIAPQIISGSTNLAYIPASASGFSGMVQSYSGGGSVYEGTDYFSNNRKVASTYANSNFFDFYGGTNETFNMEFGQSSLGTRSAVGISATALNTASITELPQINTSSNLPLYQTGTISAIQTPGWNTPLQRIGFELNKAISFSQSSALKSDFANFQAQGQQFFLGSALFGVGIASSFAHPVKFVENTFTAITHPALTLSKISTLGTTASLNPGLTAGYLTGSVFIPLGVSKGLSSIASKIAPAPDTYFIGANQISQGNKITTELIAKTDIGNREFYGYQKGITNVYDVSENVQFGKTNILGQYQEFKGSSPPPINYKWGEVVPFGAKQFSLAEKMTATATETRSFSLNNFNFDITATAQQPFNFQRTIGNIYTKTSETPFYSESTNFGKNPVYISGENFLGKNGKLTPSGSYTGALFDVKTISDDVSKGFTSFQGGGSKSSPQFFSNLYSDVKYPNVVNDLLSSQTAKILSDIPKPSVSTSSVYAQTLSSVSAQNLIPQSAYYGTGTYERTDLVSAQMPGQSQNQLMNQFNVQSFQPNVRINYSPLSLTGSTNTQAIRDFSVLSPMQTGITNDILRTPQIEQTAQALRQDVRQFSSSSYGGTGGFTPIPPPPIPPIIPPFRKGFDLRFSGLRDFGAKRITKYTPDFGSLVFGRKGRYKKTKLSKSGIDLRPITPGFSFNTGLTNTSTALDTFKKFTSKIKKVKLFSSSKSPKRKRK